jgi:hypothetical protein
MNKTFLLAALLLAAASAYPQSKPPTQYVDKGACPFECCTYRRWKAVRTTIAYASADKRSKPIGKFKAGTNVVAITGEVRTVPGKFVISKNYKKYKPGDVLWVYTPIGEGFYKVWFNGKMYEEELDFMIGPFEQSFPGCEETPECWGKLEREMRVEWWVKIRTRGGLVGWTDQADNFDNKDSCG